MKNLKQMTEILHGFFQNNQTLFKSTDLEFLLANHPKAISELRELISKFDDLDKPDNLDRAARMIQAYNSSRQELKQSYHKLARKELKKLAESLGLSEVNVSTNLAGVAVVGETTLMAMNKDGKGVSVVLGGNFSYVRAIKGMKDYTGGRNRVLPHDSFIMGDISRIVSSVLDNYEKQFE